MKLCYFYYCLFYYNLFIHLFICFFQVRIQNFLEKTKNFEKHNAVSHSQEGLRKEKEILRKRVKSFIQKKRIIEVQKLVKNEEVTPWGRDTQAKVCSHCYFLFLKSWIDEILCAYLFCLCSGF